MSNTEKQELKYRQGNELDCIFTLVMQQSTRIGIIEKNMEALFDQQEEIIELLKKKEPKKRVRRSKRN